MKITYTENPLNSTIELEEWEKKELWYKIKIEEMVDHMFEAYYHLGKDYGDYGELDLDRVAKAVRPELYFSAKENDGEGEDPSLIDQRTNQLYEYYMEEFVGPHVGDCTCVPSSCGKCHAEELIGINTIEGLSKHPAHYVRSAFGASPSSDWKDTRNINQAIDHLKNYKPSATWKGWEDHVVRWAAEAKEAYDWLTTYRDKHFPR